DGRSEAQRYLQDACGAEGGPEPGGGALREGAPDDWPHPGTHRFLDHVAPTAAARTEPADAGGHPRLHHHLLALGGHPDPGDGGAGAGALRALQRAGRRPERGRLPRRRGLRVLRLGHHLPLYRCLHHRQGHDRSRPRPPVRLPNTLPAGRREVHLRGHHRLRRDSGPALLGHLQHHDRRHAAAHRPRHDGGAQRPRQGPVWHGYGRHPPALRHGAYAHDLLRRRRRRPAHPHRHPAEPHRHRLYRGGDRRPHHLLRLGHHGGPDSVADVPGAVHDPDPAEQARGAPHHGRRGVHRRGARQARFGLARRAQHPDRLLRGRRPLDAAGRARPPVRRRRRFERLRRRGLPPRRGDGRDHRGGPALPPAHQLGRSALHPELERGRAYRLGDRDPLRRRHRARHPALGDRPRGGARQRYRGHLRFHEPAPRLRHLGHHRHPHLRDDVEYRERHHRRAHRDPHSPGRGPRPAHPGPRGGLRGVLRLHDAGLDPAERRGLRLRHDPDNQDGPLGHRLRHHRPDPYSPPYPDHGRDFPGGV
ncbi:MAG: Sodium-dependent anion transporter family, partial [uncultured Rubrobacteraceae bacterium]